MNQRAMARKEAERRGKTMDTFNAVVCHLGGG
jgi:butyrate kinase